MPRYSPSKLEWQALQDRVRKGSGEDAALADNLLFSELYHHERGLYPRRGKKAQWVREKGEWVRYKRNLSRREWIEQFFPIRDVQGKIHRMILNPAQRRFYAQILRMERAQIPVRMQILKARQQGYSTFVQAMLTEMDLRGEEVRGLIIAHDEKTASMLLTIAEIGITRMLKTEARGPHDKGEVWKFKLRSKAKDSLELDRPIYSLTQITSAKSLGAGVGGTRTLIHFSEGSRYEKPDQVHSSVLPSLPDQPGTYGFDESTAYGAMGKFHDDFWEAWKRRDEPLSERVGWMAWFSAWWEHPDYCWTKTWGRGRKLTDEKIREIENTLDAEEKWLLGQRYIKRWSPDDEWEQREFLTAQFPVYEDGKVVGTTRNWGQKEADGTRIPQKVWRRKNVGWQHVTYDQLLWRRMKLADKMSGDDKSTFDQDYPSRPQVAFRSTGAAVFDSARLDELDAKAKDIEPVFRGFLRLSGEDKPILDQIILEPHPRGVLTIWAHPEPGRDYILASDTAGGGSRSDAAVIVVLDGETGDLVAGWRERCDPHNWGPRCAWLAWYYNEGMLGFETQPSTHGLAAATEARNFGYSRLYYRVQRDTYRKTQTEILGFHNHVHSKGILISEIKKALAAGMGVPWRELIAEMRCQYWGENEKMASTRTDDMVDAYGIALVIRQDCYTRQLIRLPERKPMTETERYWAKEEARTQAVERHRTRMARGTRRPRWIQ